MLRARLHKIITAILALLMIQCRAQEPTGKTLNPAFEIRLEHLLDHSIPTLTVAEVEDSTGAYLLLDAREKEEWNTSHIKGALYLGYDDPNWEVLHDVPKDRPILLYCSVGYRSEKIGERLKEKGYKNVYNLYGSIFEWVNRGNPVVNPKNIATDTIHTYNKRWSRWVDGEKISKTW